VGGGVSGHCMAAAVLASSSSQLMVWLVSLSSHPILLRSLMVSIAVGMLVAVANGGALGVMCQHGLPQLLSLHAGSGVVQLTLSHAEGAVVTMLVMSPRMEVISEMVQAWEVPWVVVVVKVWEGMVSARVSYRHWCTV